MQDLLAIVKMYQANQTRQQRPEPDIEMGDVNRIGLEQPGEAQTENLSQAETLATPQPAEKGCSICKRILFTLLALLVLLFPLAVIYTISLAVSTYSSLEPQIPFSIDTTTSLARGSSSVTATLSKATVPSPNPSRIPVMERQEHSHSFISTFRESMSVSPTTLTSTTATPMPSGISESPPLPVTIKEQHEQQEQQTQTTSVVCESASASPTVSIPSTATLMPSGIPDSPNKLFNSSINYATAILSKATGDLEKTRSWISSNHKATPKPVKLVDYSDSEEECLGKVKRDAQNTEAQVHRAFNSIYSAVQETATFSLPILGAKHLTRQPGGRRHPLDVPGLKARLNAQLAKCEAKVNDAGIGTGSSFHRARRPSLAPALLGSPPASSEAFWSAEQQCKRLMLMKATLEKEEGPNVKRQKSTMAEKPIAAVSRDVEDLVNRGLSGEENSEGEVPNEESSDKDDATMEDSLDWEDFIE